MNQPRFTLRQLRYFVTIAECGTLSEAASRLHVAQPTLSQALTDLERALRVQLCVRRRAHGITLTPSGHQVLRQARHLLRQAEDLESAASGQGSLTGVLSVGCYVTLAPTVLPPLLQGFSAPHPELTVEFSEDTQDVLQQRLLHGELDLAILYDMDVNPELARTVLHTVRPHVLLPADHPMADRSSVSLRDLEPEPMVLLDAPPSSHNTLAIYENLGLVPRVRYRPSTIETTRALVGRGMGYALLVQRPNHDRTHEGRRVVVKEIAEQVPSARVLLAWPRATRLNRRAEEFVRFCRENSAA
ncbi:DNA-binding transcriptional regulator, LysR family [Streptoalloteichus tenebrarius]|uniref:DNA-binding transcriptional regulator, LysR family n=1 Tax=Streptoalloteichus tenebrarius (strain ATCC 17920 / DSM 40477 / JCM 4838 / CBS 697.72 / NBRC 16177 / NCIMB 11028 / NRRL B-12390 / A12253. 1 / ISP 5477) TaxID=1933 RepID=A0ABT1HLL9_STRSD|nr:LysR family transcriptional regulator [Streptoalloteichus tenebrarius]MCP2256409.1 DNA-binding transcriptional regulator, LysR family [Streptoalloteichus tenebrarius]BFF04758.1 LysR substrate-binding domain-containing protein [Streptoalloteichus tenebrarius]